MGMGIGQVKNATKLTIFNGNFVVFPQINTTSIVLSLCVISRVP